MMEFYKKIKSDIRRAGYESQSISEKVKFMKLPDDVRAWLDDAVKFANELPDETHQKMILRYVSFAERSINNEQKLKEYLYQIENSINNVKHDRKIMRQDFGAIKGGSQSKHKLWVDIVARWLLENYPNQTEDNVWERLPNQYSEERLDEDEYCDFIFYRDGEVQ
jgi:vancomycin resistance protein YoaR